MKALRAMVHDWAFWCYMVLAVITICFVAMLAYPEQQPLQQYDESPR